MASDTIKLNKEELKITLNILKESMANFTSYTTTFRDNTRDQLKSFNSDFIDKVDDLLDNMNNDMNPDLINDINVILKAGEELLKTMKEADEKIGQKIWSGQS